MDYIYPVFLVTTPFVWCRGVAAIPKIDFFNECVNPIIFLPQIIHYQIDLIPLNNIAIGYVTNVIIRKQVFVDFYCN